MQVPGFMHMCMATISQILCYFNVRGVKMFSDLVRCKFKPWKDIEKGLFLIYTDSAAKYLIN